MSSVNSKGAGIALVVGNMAGMIDLGALPLWVGGMITGYGFSPALAGGMVTLFLGAVVISSIILSRMFHKLNGRWFAPLGFWISAAAFYMLYKVEGIALFAVLHAIAGFGTGIAISFVHGTMGKRSNPHLMFAMGSLALGIAIAIFAVVTPAWVERTSSATVFLTLAIVMSFAAIITSLLFPKAELEEHNMLERPKFSRQVWCVIGGIMAMSFVQAMVFSFVERIPRDIGLSTQDIQIALAIAGAFTIVPPILAALLQKRLVALKVAIAASMSQAALAFILTTSDNFMVFAVPAVLMPFAMLFCHVFMFGYLAKNETTGAAVAATPAMVMSGSAMAPFVGGVLVQIGGGGYLALGCAAVVFSLIAVSLFTTAFREDNAQFDSPKSAASPM